MTERRRWRSLVRVVRQTAMTTVVVFPGIDFPKEHALAVSGLPAFVRCAAPGQRFHALCFLTDDPQPIEWEPS